MIGARRAEELTYEKGFARIREQGIDDLGELVAKFLDLEASAFHDWRVSRQHAEIDEAEATVAATAGGGAGGGGASGARCRCALTPSAQAAKAPRARHEEGGGGGGDASQARPSAAGRARRPRRCSAPSGAAHQLELPNRE